MVGTSKILTVSYGTFSCTLEGFDDSFETMKAIAEYFRNLAADDRYFGAEPPTPDADMLARIAEREIARRVEAREQEGRIYLRASEQAATPGAEKEGGPAPQAETQVEPVEPEAAPEPQPMAEPEAAGAAEETAPKPEATPEAIQETAQGTAAEGRLAADAADQAPEEVEKLQQVAAHEAEEEPAEAVAEPAAEIEEATAEGEEIAPESTPETKEPAAEVEQAAATPVEAADEDDSVAARLRRIRSVVARADSYGADDYSEDEHAQDFLDRTASELDATLAEDEESQAAEAVAEYDEADFLADFNAQLAAFAEQAEETEKAEEAGQQPERAEPGESFTPAREAGVSEDTLAQLLADAMPEDTGAEAPDDAAEAEEAPAEATGEPLILTDAEQVNEETEEGRPLRARVVKMKRSEFEAAVAEGRIEEDFDDAYDTFDDTDGDDGEANAILSAEDEAELQRELAEVEAELSPPPEAEPREAAEAEAKPEAEAAAEEPVATAGHADEEARVEEAAVEETEEAIEPAGHAGEDETPQVARAEDSHAENQPPRAAARLQKAAEAESSRLFERADTHFEAPEATRRRNAIQHLRAAVAATKAERKAGGTLEQDNDEDAYRSDLASVVRPRRPATRSLEGDASRSRRPSEGREAPLKLVAEQRVDTPREKVRPRRVSSAQLTAEAAPTGAESGFTEFAEEIGATTLTELLEAAAAYMADVEGRQQFSRPMLMGKLKEVENETFTREDGLRSFGHLLREGKLQKLKGGRFTVTDQTDFRAKAARQAG